MFFQIKDISHTPYGLPMTNPVLLQLPDDDEAFSNDATGNVSQSAYLMEGPFSGGNHGCTNTNSNVCFFQLFVSLILF